jgi:hypothetical protein
MTSHRAQTPSTRADAIEHGVSRNLTFYALSILNAASVFGRIIPNVSQALLDPIGADSI